MNDAQPRASEQPKPDATGPLRRPERKYKRRKSVIWRLNGDSVMPFNPHKGKQLKDIPLQWLLWLSRAKKTAKSTEASEEYKAALKRYLKNSAA